MPKSLTDLAVKGTTVISADGIAARQLEGYLARQHLAQGRMAWLASTAPTFRDWAADLWSRYLDDGSRQLLAPGQVDALWRRVIDESGSDLEGLSGFRHASTWAREASQRRRDWNIDSDELSAFRDDPDCRAFLRWERAYRDALDESGWLDPADVMAALAARTPSPGDGENTSMVWADLALTPFQSRLAEQFQRAGFHSSTWTPPPCNRRCRRVQLPDLAEEVRVAAAWASARLAQHPRQRVAIVVPRLEARREEVLVILEEALNPGSSRLGVHDGRRQIICLQGRSTAMGNPVIGAAMNALELFSEAGEFYVLSRWLRSPFFAAPEETDARCMLEARLRSNITAQMTFPDAYRYGGLAGRIRNAIPALAEELGAAVSFMDAQPRRATLTGWVSAWRRLLSELRWCGENTEVPEDWESALNDLMLQSPILGMLPLSDALVELANVLSRPQRLGPAPLHGVFLLSEPEDVGPGYDALWVCGLTDTDWPRAPRPLPLLPLALQRMYEMPSATPSTALEHSRTTLQRCVARVPDVILSTPETVHEHAVHPSPLILSYPLVAAAELAGSRTHRAPLAIADDGRIETHADPVPAVEESKISGGIGALSMHSVCPLRGFIESRLRAKPLETFRPGFSALQRGIAAHAAVGHLMSELPDQHEIRSWSTEDRSSRVDRSCYRALRRMFGRAETRLGALLDLERARLRSIVNQLLEMDLTRAPFRVIAVEKAIQATIGGLEASGRIDRIDILDSDGGLAVIDYKTGTRHYPGDWFKQRPRDLQLPFYASSLEGDVDAVVIAMLHPQNPAYKGIWLGDGQFSGRAARLPADLVWATQRDRWRTLLDDLAREFAEGDGRIFRSNLRYADGPMAPLTRIHECMALARKSDS